MLISFSYSGHMHPQHKTETLVNEMHGCFHSSATDEGHTLISVAASIKTWLDPILHGNHV